MITTAQHCCGADLFFNTKKANREYRNYIKKGPSRVTKKIIRQLTEQDVEGKSLVDIGGGIGALQWWFLEQGGQHTTDIDASSGYLKQAQNHAMERGWQDKTSFVKGDFMEVYSQVEAANFMTLDKVVCCYPNFREILDATCSKAKECISLSYPMDGIVSRLIGFMGGLFFKLKQNPFKPYIHPVTEIRSIITERGFKAVRRELVFPWHVETYRRT